MSAVVTVALVASLAGVVPAGARPRPESARPRATRIETGTDEVLSERLSGTLSSKVKASRKTGGSAQVDVAVLTDKGASRPKDLRLAVRASLKADPAHDLWVGKARVDRLVKLASADAVEFVFDNGRRTPPPAPDKGKRKSSGAEKKAQVAKARARLAAARKSGAIDEFRSSFDDEGVPVESAASTAPDGGGAPTGWWDVGPNGHRSELAWDLGYTGAGVRIAVADDSADLAHPDLQDTFAVVEDASSPYYGWPMAFDPYSLLLYTYDQYYPTTFIADNNGGRDFQDDYGAGGGWFSETTDTVTAGSPVWESDEYTLPGTSLSGTYHIGRLWDENLADHDGGWLGHYPAILVADESTAGVYDTVYVDLDGDLDFTTDKPCTKASPTSYLDLWGPGYGGGPDGFADISGGTTYWIADGSHHPPAFEEFFADPDLPLPAAPGPGDLVCFMGALRHGEDHGTLCSSNVVGQGRIDGPSDSWFEADPYYPPFKTPEGNGAGIVQGAARDGELVPMADIYWNHFGSTLWAYDYAAFGLDGIAGTGDEIQVVSNSYGESGEDADEWDYRSRYVTALNTDYAPQTAYLFATGNGAPGYGTNAPPTPSTGIGIGASTQFGACGGWDGSWSPTFTAGQVVVGDVIPWSNRGPSAAGHLGPAVVADGAYSSGAIPLNMGNWIGWESWYIWGGTSRSAPVAAGNLALVYDAYKAAHGTFPTAEQARGLIMAGATDVNNDTLVQGAGMVNAERAVRLAAADDGVAVSPSSWFPGDFRGGVYPGYTQLLAPGDTDSRTLTVTNVGGSPVDVAIDDAWYQRTETVTMTVVLDGAEESPYDFDRPDYLTDITPLIPAEADLMVVRLAMPFDEFSPNLSYAWRDREKNVPRLLVYDWTDRNGNGRLWDDANMNGFVNTGEMDEGEHMRFTYLNNFANTSEVRVQRPLDRAHDGVLLGLQHNFRATSDPQATVQLEISFWQRDDMPWLDVDEDALSLAAGASDTVQMNVSVPATAPVGTYEGQYRVSVGTTVSVVPVHLTVASPDSSFAFGDVADTPEQLMAGNEMFGAQSWNWRPESGDWRFYSADVTDTLPPGAAWLVHTSWPERGGWLPDAATDIDTLLYGSEPDGFSALWPATFGPGTLSFMGGSANTNSSAGVWTFETRTGATDEWVSGPLAGGLNGVMLHNVVHDGVSIGSTFTGEAGVVGLDPSALSLVTTAAAGTEPVDFTTLDLPLNGVSVDAYGLAKRVEERHAVGNKQEWSYQTTLTGAAYLEVQTECPDSDIDLYVDSWTGAEWKEIAGSESSSGDERIRIDTPADGRYRVRVVGYAVTGSGEFDVSVSSPMGSDLLISGVPGGPLGAGEGFTFDIDWAKLRGPALVDREGTFEGVVYVGPNEAPTALTLPVTLRYPFYAEQQSPVSAVDDRLTPVVVRFSKRVDPATLNASTFYLKSGAVTQTGSIAYDPGSATATLTVVGLDDDAAYTAHIDGVSSMDGDSLDTSWTFDTGWLSRDAGTDRYDTAVKTCQAAFASADTVILANGENFPDALAASGLAGAYDAPLLLTPSKSLWPTVADEIERLGASTVIAVGGEPALASSVLAAADAAPGVDVVERIEGPDRYATAAAVAARVSSEAGMSFPHSAFVVRGDQFADALASSPFAFSQKMPVLLTRPTSLPDVTADAITSLGIQNVVIAGSTAAVSGGVASAIDALPGVNTPERVQGSDRFATAAELADYGAARSWGSYAKVGVANGLNFPDALGGGVATGKTGGVVLMTAPTALSAPAATRFTNNTGVVRRVEIFGSAAAVSAAVEAAIKGLL